VNPPVTRATLSGRIYNDLRNLARRNKRATEEYLHFYVLEGFLERLVSSPYESALVLKGGVLLAAYDVRRPTADVDLAAQGLSNEVPIVREMVTEIASVHLDDGIEFDTSQVSAAVIRDEDTYSGVRVAIQTRLASARLPFHIDVNVGDPIWPSPVQVQVPRILGGEVTMRGYPLVMILAEKIVTAVDRGVANTRWRDFADIYRLTKAHRLRGDEAQSAIEKVASFRKVQLAPISGVLDGYRETGQRQWGQWRRKRQLDGVLPDRFADVLRQVEGFADPAIAQAVGDHVWLPGEGRWASMP
jgi:hypothetical protein